MTAKNKRRDGKVPAKNKVPTGDAVLENPDRKWQLRVGPKETVLAAEHAPLRQMVVQNVGQAIVEVHSGELGRESVILMPGKLTVMLAYGRITIENVEDKWAIVEMDFAPRMKL
jgi:hypothetical protein